MRISDWSSDVCSSDLKTQNYALSIAATTAHGLFSNPFSVMPPTSAAKAHRAATPHSGPADARRGAQVRNPRFQLPADRIATTLQGWLEQDRKSGVKGKRGYVSVDVGGGGSREKK